MNSIDRFKNAVPGGTDIPGLGENTALPALPKHEIRHQLSFADESCLKTERRAVALLLQRITHYYDVIGYLSPTITRHKAEIGRSFGRWFEEKAYGKDSSRRESFHTTDRYIWSAPERVFNSVRFACAETALLLAKWEFIQEVPESERVIYRSVWSALRAIQSRELTGVRWHDKRCRWGSNGFKKHLQQVCSVIETAEYLPGIHHGYFKSPQKVLHD